jgi:hypothetical protein
MKKKIYSLVLFMLVLTLTTGVVFAAETEVESKNQDSKLKVSGSVEVIVSSDEEDDAQELDTEADIRLNMDYDFNDNWQLATELKLADKDSSLATYDYGDVERAGITRDLGSGVFDLGKTELTGKLSGGDFRAFYKSNGRDSGDPLGLFAAKDYALVPDGNGSKKDKYEGDEEIEDRTAGIDFSKTVGSTEVYASILTKVTREAENTEAWDWDGIQEESQLFMLNAKRSLGDATTLTAGLLGEAGDDKYEQDKMDRIDNDATVYVTADHKVTQGIFKGWNVTGELAGSEADGEAIGWAAKAGKSFGNVYVEAFWKDYGKDLWQKYNGDSSANAKRNGKRYLKADINLPNNMKTGFYTDQWYGYDRDEDDEMSFLSWYGKIYYDWKFSQKAGLKSYFSGKLFKQPRWNVDDFERMEEYKCQVALNYKTNDRLNTDFIVHTDGELDWGLNEFRATKTVMVRTDYTIFEGLSVYTELSTNSLDIYDGNYATNHKELLSDGDFTTNLYTKLTKQLNTGEISFSYGKTTFDEDDKDSDGDTTEVYSGDTQDYYEVKYTVNF